ncbi:glutaredoxin family protein [Candidatus Neptunochlamydia vexilliferae]|nr:glutaredoxin [Candidatus Neptunochlamydia vexilliferae]
MMYDIDPAIIQPAYCEERTVTQLKCVEKPELVLYMRPSCPYCQRVTRYLQSIGKTIPQKDIGKDKQAAAELIRVGGKRQVPCLFINGKPLYESRDIINWLKANQDKY